MILLLAVAVPASARQHASVAQPIYAAFSVVKKRPVVIKKCGSYSVATGVYDGTSASPDRRLAGIATMSLKTIADLDTGTGIETGTLDIRDAHGIRRLHSRITGVVSQHTTVNGLVSGAMTGPRATLLANVTITFDSVWGFAIIRLGIEDGANSAVVYPTLPKCR